VPLAVTIYGYPTDKVPAGKQWESDGEADILSFSKIFYRNSTYGGMSGSPVFVATDKKIVAVHTNGLHGTPPWNSYNAATRLSDDLIQSLTKFIEE
jgi:V8-like Glu-specific endopeptidase